MTFTRRELVALGVAFLLTLPAVTTRLYASDEVEYFAWLRSAAFDRDVDFQNEYQHFYDAGVSQTPAFHETFLERTTEIGKRINYATPGSAFLWAPFYALGHVAALATGAAVDGFSQPYIAAVAYGSACYAFLAVLLSADIARRIVGRGLAASLIVAFGTPLLFYAYVAPGFGHATSAFSVSLFIWTWLRVRGEWTARGALALGLCAGLMGTVREQDLFLAIGPGIDFLAAARRSISRPADGGVRRTIAAGATGVVTFLAAFTPQLLAYTALNGHPGATETAARKMTWTAPHAFGVLFSPEHGFFAWTPLALLAVAGLVVLALRGQDASATGDTRWIAGLLVLMIAVQAYTSGSVESWTVSGAFGQRRFVALTPILTVGLAALLARSGPGWPRRLAIAGLVLTMWWNLGLMAQFGLHRMDRARLSLMDNARVTFIELPIEMPRIAWRYLTDRNSLYRLPRQ
jgi:hypothetical protein